MTSVKQKDDDLSLELKNIEGSITLANDARNIENNLNFNEILARDEWEHRKKISSEVISAFKKVNNAIIFIIVIFFLIENLMIYLNVNPNYNRTIDAKLMMTLIGATTVQFGAISLGISNWLFPKGKGK